MICQVERKGETCLVHEGRKLTSKQKAERVKWSTNSLDKYWKEAFSTTAWEKDRYVCRQCWITYTTVRVPLSQRDIDEQRVWQAVKLSKSDDVTMVPAAKARKRRMSEPTLSRGQRMVLKAVRISSCIRARFSCYSAGTTRYRQHRDHWACSFGVSATSTCLVSRATIEQLVWCSCSECTASTGKRTSIRCVSCVEAENRCSR